MSNSSARKSIGIVGLFLLLSGAFVSLLCQPAQASNAFGPTDIRVKKTAHVAGTVVSGKITIKNVGDNPAEITSIVDSLEVRFPKGVTPPPLPSGSEAKWLQAALVPGLQAVPNPIPSGQTVIIQYSFDTCQASDYTGANKMRNVVSVTLANGPTGSKTVTKHSPGFAPPSQAGCATCGDGTANGSEECDDTDLKGETCTSRGFVGGGTLACTPSCTFDTSNCSSCGDDVVDSGEDCDGSNLNGQSCSSLSQGFTGGTLACASSCTFDTTNCSTCGDNLAESPDEECDGSDLQGQSCTSLAGHNFGGGTLACSSSCTFDISNCSNCGNGVVDSGEDCDGTNLNGNDCTTIGQNFGSGTLACTSSCTFDTSGCSTCGNGVVDAGEDCDGSDLNSKTCTDLGFTGGGTLACTPSCTFDTAGCNNE